MFVLVGRSFWTSKGRHPGCTAIIAKVFWKDLQNCWARRSLETICHTALMLYRKSDKAELSFPVCSPNLPSLLTWGERQEYPGASNSVLGPIQHSSNYHFCLPLSFFLGNITEDNSTYFKACDAPSSTNRLILGRERNTLVLWIARSQNQI